jgi:hypothetical protein
MSATMAYSGNVPYKKMNEGRDRGRGGQTD